MTGIELEIAMGMCDKLVYRGDDINSCVGMFYGHDRILKLTPAAVVVIKSVSATAAVFKWLRSPQQ